MTTRFHPTDFEPTLDPEVLREGARRQFRFSWILLLALAFAAIGQVRPFDSAPDAARLGHSRVVTPTFAPSPAALTRPPSVAGASVG
ncbi:MAG: hypothetical protein ABR863_03535 [Roseiarcus sp.]|jgi:hypothetical protein